MLPGLRLTRLLAIALLAVLALPAAAMAKKDVKVQLLGINDFHGHVESNTPGSIAPDPVSSLAIGGTPLDPAASYRITVNSFLADGGDRFPVLREGTDRLGGAVDTDALEAYIEPSLTGDPIAPPALDRIDVVS
jgi:2',3'-cyclic-nucleotide 2'-phosphodiesterase (5'-nucleotidase family)